MMIYPQWMTMMCDEDGQLVTAHSMKPRQFWPEMGF
jgi:hypothetical protein